jgi:hypothetical protein
MNRPYNPESGHLPEEKTETRKKAEKAILDTLGLGPDVGLENFPDKLKAAIKSLPQYKRFEQQMALVAKEQLPLEVFKAIRKSNDVHEERTDIPTDGVLISSMEQGHIECAGRTYIASTYLQEQGFPHTVVEAPSHSMLLFEIGDDTLGYCDANHNLYFTFPRAALKGYEGANTLSECRLEEYTPRPKDISEGLDMTYGHFITIPAKEGVPQQYLGSIKAALAGLPEFAKTPIPKDREAADEIDSIQAEMFGEQDERLMQYFEKDQQMVQDREAQATSLQQKLRELLQTVKSKEEFISSFDSVIQGDEGQLLTYIKNAPDVVKQKYADEIWERMHS